MTSYTVALVMEAAFPDLVKNSLFPIAFVLYIATPFLSLLGIVDSLRSRRTWQSVMGFTVCASVVLVFAVTWLMVWTGIMQS
jgi:hypothetical protein